MTSWCSSDWATVARYRPVVHTITLPELAALATKVGKAPAARFSIAPADEVVLPHVDGVLAGVAEVDITPPPGMPKAGFSKNAHDGIGFRHRLRARVLHLRSGSASVAWVQLDLLAGSSLLQHLIAHEIADRTDIGLSGLMLGATHTHAGPGQFDASDFYNRFASNRPGFDPAWTAWLVERIAGAVVQAHDSRQPAQVATGRIDVWGATRNRSLAPYIRNDVEDQRLDPERRFGAVNPWLHQVRVDTITADGTEPLAAWSVFSIHGTGVNHHNTEYHPDVWAYLVDEFTGRVGGDFVAAAVEGTHGDAAPALRPGRAGFLESERIGRMIGSRAADLHEQLAAQLTDRVDLSAVLHEVDLDAPDGGEVAGVRLPLPALGASQVAGATENLTPVISKIPPISPGHPKRRGRGPHGEKWVLGSQRLQSKVLPRSGFPRVLSVQALRIGGLLTVGFPFEITTEAGRRISEASAAAGIDAEVVVASVTNGYCGYCTTAEEYSLQFYEGGHNLHGPKTEAWLSAQGARLVAALAGEAAHQRSVLPERRFDLHVHRYLAVADGQDSVQFDGAARYVDSSGEDPDFWQQAWQGGAPGSLTWHEPIARVEVETDGSWHTFADDQGTSIGVTWQGKNRYVARWFSPWLGGDRRFRFVINGTAGDPFWCGPSAVSR